MKQKTLDEVFAKSNQKINQKNNKDLLNNN